ncbi:MAG: hypothetical protein ACR2O1_00715 [Boseongicola sp.]
MSAITFVVVMIVSGFNQVTDPFVRHDDFSALLLRPQDYYLKTLSEGRWINYWWHFRSFETAAWINYAVYIAGWATFCAGVALHTLDSRVLFYPVFLAILIAVAPQATLISLWFNTLIPGVWILAAYAILTLFATPRLGILLLLIFVPLSVMTYSTYPLLLLCICLLRKDNAKSFAGLIVTLVVFAISFALGLTLINTLNYFDHGVFGIEISNWRNPSRAEDLQGIIQNLPKVWRFLGRTATTMGYGSLHIGYVNMALLAVSFILLAHRSIREALFWASALLAGFGLLILHILLEGAGVPFRATLFFWLLFAVSVAKVSHSQLSKSELAASVGRICLLTLTFTSAYLANLYYGTLTEWQRSTREIASGITAEQSTVYVYGGYIAASGGLEARIQHPRGLRHRLAKLTSAEFILCEEQPEKCQGISPPFDPRPTYGPILVSYDGNIAYVRLPEVEFGP